MPLRFCFLWLALIAWAWPQSLRPEQMMVLLIGPSASRPSADHQAVLARLKALKGQAAFRQLKIATMHFDRPAEAKFARRVLGVEANQLPCLCLVQLDSQLKRPVKKLYSLPNVTRRHLEQVEQMGQIWSQSAGQASALLSKDRMVGGQSLPVNASLLSHNGMYALALQADGNLVVSRLSPAPAAPLWSSGSENQGANRLTLGNDGILRLYAEDGRVVWQTQGGGQLGSYFLQMQDDGNAVIYRLEAGTPQPIWDSFSTIWR